MGNPRRFLLIALVASVLIAPTLGAARSPSPVPPTAEDALLPAAVVVAPVLQPADPQHELLTNDPERAPGAIADRLGQLIDATPAGERIDVTTYYLGSVRLGAALERAVLRGVAVHLLLAGDRRARGMRPSQELARLVDQHPDAGSWVRHADGAARGGDGLMHQKSWLFSRTGDRQAVVVVGSYNPSRLSDRYGYAHMVQVSGDEDLYRTFADVFGDQARGRRPAKPLVTADGTDWSAYFMPMNRPTPGADPVLRRLARIPAAPSTTIRIEMYSMWGERGEWIADRLAAMARGGARITLLAGPTVSDPVQGILRSAGVRVESACFADGSYTHAKEMSATWGAGARQVWWTWLGSDNWTEGGALDDEAVLGVMDRQLYDDFHDAFEQVRRRSGVSLDDCRPVRD